MLLTFQVFFFFTSIYGFPGRQPASKPQSPGRVPHLPLLLRYQLDDSHLYTSVSSDRKRLCNTDWSFFLNAAV